MKRWISLLVALLLVTTTFAQHSLKFLFIDVVLDTNGDAYVQEMRTMNIGSSGTENYIKFNNLQDGMELKDLSVLEDSVVYTFDKHWDLDRSRSEKKYHCGFNYTDEGTEVCWGVGDEGYHFYRVRYVITNLVRSYEESDGFNHSFYEAAFPAAESAYVNIRALQRNESLQYTSDDIWSLPCFQVTTPKQWVDMNLSSENKESAEVAGDSTVVAVDIALALDSLLLAKEPVERLRLDTLQHPSTKAWAFGFYGYLLFTDDGVLRAQNDSTYMTNSNSIIVMAEFEKGLFNPAMKGEVSKFETVKERAFYDSDYTLDDEEDGTLRRASVLGGDNTPMWINYLAIIVVALLVGGLILLPVALIVYGIIRLIWGKKIDQRKWEKKLSKLIGGDVRNLPYHRDPPMDGKLTCSQRILNTMRRTDQVGISQLIEAFILRLLYKGSIQISSEVTQKGKVRDVFQIMPPEKVYVDHESQDHQDIMQLYSRPMQDAINDRERKLGVKIDDNHLEHLLHQLLYLAAGKDHLLQPDELKKYIEDHALAVRPYARLLNYMVNANITLDKLPREGAKEVYCFHKFLKDFTLVNERELSEVSLWKEYLVFASLYGIAEQVRKGMKKVAPDVMKLDKITSMLLASGVTSVYVGSLVTTMQNSYRYVQNFRTAEEIRVAKIAAAEAAARAAREHRYSGGGGRSSYHGGGGHSGGGGSGVR